MSIFGYSTISGRFVLPAGVAVSLLSMATNTDVLGELQEHLRLYSKAVADTIWELQQMRTPDLDKVDSLADGLSTLADKLDGPGGLIDSLPDYPRSTDKVQEKLVHLTKEHEALEPQLLKVLADTELKQQQLRERLESATKNLIYTANSGSGER